MNIFKKKKKPKPANNFFGSFAEPAAKPANNFFGSFADTPASSSAPASAESSSSSLSRPQTPTPATPPSPSPTAYFGIHLDDLLKRSGERGLVPVLVEQCLNYLQTNDGFLIEGIFHIPGDNGIVQKLKQMADKGERVELGALREMCQGSTNGEEIRVAASLLWLFLRQLPEPILTYESFNNLLASSQGGSQDIVAALQEALPYLPPSNREIIRRVLPFLAKVVQHSYINKMTTSNIASIFAPCFVRPRVEPLGDEQARRNSNAALLVTQTLIECHAEILDDKANSTSTSDNSNSRPQTPEYKTQLQPRKDSSPQLNRWKYQTFTHPSAEKLRNITPIPTSPILPQRASTPPITLPAPPSIPPSTYPPSNPAPQSYPSNFSPEPANFQTTTYTPTVNPQPLYPPPSVYPQQAPIAVVYPQTAAIPVNAPTLSSTRIHEIIAAQEARFRDMQRVLASAQGEIDKALSSNAALSHRLASLDEVLRNEAEVLHNIVEKEKEKVALYAM